MSSEIFDRLDRFEEKIDRQGERLTNIDVTLVKQNATLEEHVRRTTAVEALVVTKADASALEKIRADLEPLKAQSSMLKGAMKVVGIGLGAAAAVVELIHAMSR